MRIAGAALLALLAGCLVPPDVEPARPPPSNQPPFALRAWPEPGVIRVARDCVDELTFRLEGISDCDPADTVTVRWFQNYGPTATGVAGETSSRGGPGVSQCMRSPSESTFRAQDTGTDTIVQIEAVLSDGFAPADRQPANRAAEAGRAVTRVGWTLEIYEGEGCAR